MASIYFFFSYDFGVWNFVVGILAFDLSMVGYLFNKRFGARIYNVGHSFVVPAITFIVAHQVESRFYLGLSLLWLALIGMDRAFGYGLKKDTGFRHTHLGQIGGK